MQRLSMISPSPGVIPERRPLPRSRSTSPAGPPCLRGFLLPVVSSRRLSCSCYVRARRCCYGVSPSDPLSNTDACFAALAFSRSRRRRIHPQAQTRVATLNVNICVRVAVRHCLHVGIYGFPVQNRFWRELSQAMRQDDRTAPRTANPLCRNEVGAIYASSPNQSRGRR